MAENALDPDIDMIIASLRDDFIVDALDKLEDIENSLDAIADGEGRYDNHLLEILRLVHSIKGMGGSFGFPSISRIAHAMEEFIDVSGSHDKVPSDPCGIYVRAMRNILNMGENPSDEETAMILDQLPVPLQPGVKEVTRFKGKALLLMPVGVQRKIIARELGIFGLRTTIYDDPMAGLDFALSGATDLILTTMHLPRMTGLELAGALLQFDRTRHIKVAVFTADDDAAPVNQPENATVVAKGPTFGRDLVSYLTRAGFG